MINDPCKDDRRQASTFCKKLVATKPRFYDIEVNTEFRHQIPQSIF